MKLKARFALFLFAVGVGSAAFAESRSGCRWECKNEYVECMEWGYGSPEMCLVWNQECTNECP